MRRGLAAITLAAAASFTLTAASTATYSRATAKAVAEAQLTVPMTLSLCTHRTQSGFFAGKVSYMASCANADDTFEFYSIATAKETLAQSEVAIHEEAGSRHLRRGGTGVPRRRRAEV